MNNKRDLEARWIVDHIAGPIFAQEEIERVRRGDPLPLIPTVYFLVQDDTILYIGQSQCLPLRVRQHERKQKRVIPFTHIEYFTPGLGDLSDRLRLEAVLVALVVPKFNNALLLRCCPASRKLVEIRFGRRARRGRSRKGR